MPNSPGNIIFSSEILKYNIKCFSPVYKLNSKISKLTIKLSVFWSNTHTVDKLNETIFNFHLYRTKSFSFIHKLLWDWKILRSHLPKWR